MQRRRQAAVLRPEARTGDVHFDALEPRNDAGHAFWTGLGVGTQSQSQKRNPLGVSTTVRHGLFFTWDPTWLSSSSLRLRHCGSGHSHAARQPPIGASRHLRLRVVDGKWASCSELGSACGKCVCFVFKCDLRLLPLFFLIGQVLKEFWHGCGVKG